MNLLEAAGGRRFVISVMAGVSSTVLQWYGKLDPAGTSYVMLIGATIGAYIGGNTLQKIKGASDPYTDRQAAKIAPSAKLPGGNDDTANN